MFARRRHWIFDLDGTLTVANIDFAALRDALGAPAEAPILEWIAGRPAPEAARLTRRLDALEAELAARTEPQPGCARALGDLVERGCRLAILTRNTRANARLTLERLGLTALVEADCVLGREDARPKPDPDGILRILERWGAAPASAVMTGDFRFDLEAGRRAGVACVHFDPDARHPFGDLADACIDRLDALPRLLD